MEPTKPSFLKVPLLHPTTPQDEDVIDDCSGLDELGHRDSPQIPSASNTSWSLLGCCTSIASRVFQAFTCCRKSSRPQESEYEDEEPASPLLFSVDRLSSACTACAVRCENVFSITSRFFNNKYVLGSLTLIGIGGVVYSAISVSPIYRAYSYACANELSGFSGDLRTCQTPYADRISTYETLIATSSGLLGFILQKLWERDINLIPQGARASSTPEVQPRLHSSPPHPHSHTEVCFNRLRKMVGSIQDNYSYEITLFLGYLYDGLWTNTITPASWVVYFDCHATAIGFASACLGMYARLITVFVIEHFKQQAANSQQEPVYNNTNLISDRNYILLTLCGAAIIPLGISTANALPSGMNQVTREISVMMLARPFGKFGTDLVYNLKNKHKEGWKKYFALGSSTVLRVLPSPLIIGAYLTYYLSSQSDAPQLTGMALIGIAQGMRESRYIPTQIKVEEEMGSVIRPKSECLFLASRMARLAKNHWPTLGVVGFWIVSAKLSLLKCYDYTTDICPISFELSSNYIQLDQRGMNIALAAGLAHYYSRKFFRLALDKNVPYIQKLSKFYLHMFDKYQFDIISLIPFTMTKSGTYTPEYDVYACLNPPAVMVFVATSFGTYKDNVDVQASDPYRPVFTDMSIVKNALPIM